LCGEAEIQLAAGLLPVYKPELRYLP
jgi:hypothetical protein